MSDGELDRGKRDRRAARADVTAHNRSLMSTLEEVYATVGGADAVGATALVLATRLERLGADAGFVAALSPDGDTVEVARVTPDSSAPVRLAFPSEAPYPLAAAIRDDESLFFSSNDALACDHPGLVRLRADDHACATLPLHGDAGRIVGSLNVSFESPREFTADDRRAIAAVKDECEAAFAQATSLAR